MISEGQLDVVSSLRATASIVGSDQQVSFRPESPRDDRFVRDLVADPDGGVLLMPVDVRDMLCEIQYREQRREWAASHPGAVAEIVVLAGRAVGRILVQGDPEFVRVLDLTVHRDHRRRGIASAVLRQVSDDPRPALIDVPESHQPMLAVCRQLGFVPIGVNAGCVALRHAVPVTA